jgi:hypothetical protein
MRPSKLSKKGCRVKIDLLKCFTKGESHPKSGSRWHQENLPEFYSNLGVPTFAPDQTRIRALFHGPRLPIPVAIPFPYFISNFNTTHLTIQRRRWMRFQVESVWIWNMHSGHTGNCTVLKYILGWNHCSEINYNFRKPIWRLLKFIGGIGIGRGETELFLKTRGW